MIMMIFCLKSRRGGVAELMGKGKMERGAVLDKQDLDFPVHSLSYCWHVQADVRRKKTNKDNLAASEGYSNADVGEHASIDNIKAHSLNSSAPSESPPRTPHQSPLEDPTP